MKNVLKNRLAILLALAMVLSISPTVAAKEDESVGLEKIEKTYAASSGYIHTLKGDTLYFNEGVTTIPENYFWDMIDYENMNSETEQEFYKIDDNAKKIVIPASVTNIEVSKWGWSALNTFSNITEIVVDPANTSFKVVNDILVNTACTKIYGVPTNYKKKSVVVPEGIKDISNLNFMNNITSISIPASVTKLGKPWGPLDGANLKTIKIDSKNSKFKVVDGVVYSKDMKKIIKYPAKKSGTSYTIGSKVTTIGYAAFHYQHSLKSIVVPAKVNKIEGKALGVRIQDNKPVKITFKGKAPSSIEKNAFYFAQNLTVYYPKEYESTWKSKTNKYYGSNMYSMKWKSN